MDYKKRELYKDFFENNIENLEINQNGNEISITYSAERPAYFIFDTMCWDQELCLKPKKRLGK